MDYINDEILRWLSSRLKIRATKIKEDTLSAFVRDSVCKFQLEFSQFAFKASLMHKEFKNNQNDITLKSLEDFFVEETKFCVNKIVDDIEIYFKVAHTNKTPPRIGIMSIVDGENALRIVAQRPVKEKNLKKNISDYTCFTHIEETGKSYLCNNLPLEIKTENFKHAGIDFEKALSYKSRLKGNNKVEKFLSRIKPQDRADVAWGKIFRQSTLNQHTFYKSHFIVPITFKKWSERDAINDDFKELILSDEGRSILGCIAIDHQNTFYFDDKSPDSSDRYDNIDANMMYMFADLISLYFVVQRTYTVGSKTYSDFLKTKMES